MSNKPVTNAQRSATYAFPRENLNGAPAQTAVGASAGTILNENRARRGLIIQNTGTTVIYLTLGSTNPTVTAYHMALKACTNANDGTGGIYSDDSWIGQVNAIGSAGGGTIVITEVE